MSLLKFFIACTLSFLGVFCFSAFALGQVSEEASLLSLDEDMNGGVLVASVEIYDAQITQQDGNVFHIAFDLANGEGAQSDIRYAVRLIQVQEENEFIVDELVYSERVDLASNTTVKKEIVYTAPEYLKGSYELHIESQNGSGLPLAFGFLEEVVLEGDGQYLEILETSCFLQVEGEEGQPKYSLLQGTDIFPEETLDLTCTIKNHTESDLSVQPFFSTFYRSSLGDEVEDVDSVEQTVLINALEEKVVTISLPKADVPQSYNVKIVFKDDVEVLSNTLDVHYVLRGQSATIQNVTLDKTSYEKGETAQVSLTWSGSADGFFGAREEEESSIEGLAGSIHIVDGDGSVCGEDVKVTLQDIIKQTVPFFMTKKCVSPKVTTMLFDVSGNILATSELEFTDPVSTTTSETSTVTTFSLLLYIFVVIASFSVIGYVVFRSRTHKDGMFSMLLFLVFFVSAVLIGGTPREADAATIVVGGRNDKVTLTYSVSKSTYTYGQTVQSSVRMSSYVCANQLSIPKNAAMNLDGPGGALTPLSGTRAYTKFYSGPSVGKHYIAFSGSVRACKVGVAPGCAWQVYYWGPKTLNFTVSGSSCSLPWGGTIADGRSVTAYRTSSVSCGWSCPSITRTCNNGTLSGSSAYKYRTCTVQACTAPCRLPWGGTISDGRSVRAYRTSSVPCGSRCSSIIRSCDNGTLSGSSAYRYEDCSVRRCPSPCRLPWGGTISDGRSVRAYRTSSVECGRSCSSEDQIRRCNDGTLSGSSAYRYEDCSVRRCPSSCTLPWGGTIADGRSVNAFRTTSVPCGSSCSSEDQTRICNDGTLSGSSAYKHENCTPEACSNSIGPPAIDGPINFPTGTDQLFTFVVTDPEGDHIHYGIDCDNNGVVDSWIPSPTGFISSGSSRTAYCSWDTAGPHSLRVFVEDTEGNLNSAVYPVIVTLAAIPEDGVCNDAVVYGCVVGTSENNADNSFSWRWDCEGLNGGDTVNCSEPKDVNGICGTADGTTVASAPEASTPVDTVLCGVTSASPTVVSGFGPWTWSCVGSGGGTTASCSANQDASTCPNGICDPGETFGNCPEDCPFNFTEF